MAESLPTSSPPEPPNRSSPALESDVQLVVRARRGDREAFGRLYERFGSTVHGVLLAHAPREDVHDLVQDVFLAAWRTLGRLEAPKRFAGWLVTMARNRARDAHRLRRVPEELSDDIVAPVNAAPMGAASGDEDLEARELLASVRGLPEAYRTTLILRLVEGLTGPEIAARTGLTPGSVRVNLHRGMKLLRERLEPLRDGRGGPA